MNRFLDWLNADTDRRVCLALLALCAAIYIPFAGNYGMWDPWETHYGEVARQMVERHDWISLWWPGSPQDRQEFWSKPVLTFWLIGLSMKLVGLRAGLDSPAEMVTTWKVEWASRMPFILLGIAGVWATWELGRRLAGRRVGVIAALILATSSQWALITRQAMTDMAFVTPMTIALVFAGLGLLLPAEERERELPRGQLGPLSFPRATAYYVFLALFALSTVPQLVMISIDLKLSQRFGSVIIHFPGVVAMLPYIAAFLVAVWWCSRARNLRQLYLFSGYVLCAIASLAKGPAGLALPAIVLGVYLVLAGRWKEIWTRLELPRGLILFIACAVPWYHAMLIRHGMGFYNEFFLDNYVHRAGGRHGDRGTFEYYIEWIGYGMFPWSGLVTLGGLFAFQDIRRARRPGQDLRRGLTGFCLVWFLVEFAVMTFVNTKFHHYILPALPALAILAALVVDDLLSAPRLSQIIATVMIAFPVTFMCGRDLAAFPPRLLWLFNYDYVNAPGTGRPWPSPTIYGDRYEYGAQVLIFCALATLLTGVFAMIAARVKVRDVNPRAALPVRGLMLVALATFVLLFLSAIALGPATANGAAPTIGRHAWLLPAVLMLSFAPWLIAAAGWPRSWSWRESTFWLLGAVAIVWTAFLIDKVLVEVSPHWSQKHVIASYYAKRSGPEEPLIAWQLYWRGENFYTKNAIYRSSNPAERTVFLGDRNAEHLQQYLTAHPGHRVFFVVERARFETLRALLPAAARPTLSVVDESNNKIYLAVAQL